MPRCNTWRQRCPTRLLQGPHKPSARRGHATNSPHRLEAPVSTRLKASPRTAPCALILLGLRSYPGRLRLRHFLVALR